jgi:hypothetical protein
MQLSEVFLHLGEDRFTQLVRGISIGRLKTFQMYDPFKTRAHLAKLNTENLRKAAPRLRARIAEGDDDLARDLAQAILVSHLDMIAAVLDFLGIPNENGFFAKDLEAVKFLAEGWAGRVYDHFKTVYPEPLLLFYINHLAWELKTADALFAPAA